MRHHPSIFGDPDETPENPNAPDNGDRSPAEGVVNELESRLFKGRKVMVFGHITDKLARDVVSRVLALRETAEIGYFQRVPSLSLLSFCLPTRSATTTMDQT